MGPATALVGYYDYRLVALSVFLSILAAYASLDLAERVTTAQRGARLAWLYGGAIAMGIGIWAMHYVGMVAFHLPIPVLYDWPTVVLSLVIAILASGIALFIVSRATMGPLRTAAGSLVMGAGIAAMHYVGMEAMRLQAMCLYSVVGVALSCLLAVAISFVALQLAFTGRDNPASGGRRKLLSALAMGVAIPTMHYAGMAAAAFVPQPAFNASVKHAVPITDVRLMVIVVAVTIVLGHVFMVSTVNRRFTRQAREHADTGLQIRAIFDNLAEGIAVHEPGGRLVQMNAAAKRILGITSDALTFEDVLNGFELRGADGQPLPLAEWPALRALRGDYVRNCELEVYARLTGKSIVVEISTAPISATSGIVGQVIVSYREITERKRTEELQARLAAIVESCQDAVIGKDLNGIVTSWNKGAETTFGYTAGEIIGHSIQQLLPPGHEHEEDGILERVRRGESIHQLETTRLRKDGRIVQVSLMICPILDGSGRVVGASKIARDITERKLMERQLRQSQKMEAIGQLTGGIAHDFNNLLAIVIGNLGLLERAIAGNEIALKRLRPAQKAAARGADLTRRLLALASKEELNPASVRLEDSIHEVIELAARALGPEIKIQTAGDAAAQPVFVDAAGLESALLNLAVNARDAMPKGGTLTFNTRMSHLDDSFPSVQAGELKPGPYACISVSDTGCGMSKETVERAMEPFFTTKPRNKGTGLGLAMVYGFARQSGGTVRIYSEEGYGTTVSLYLPLASHTTPVAAEAPQARRPHLPGGTVLVVDDEVDLLEIAHTYLMELGYEAMRADSAATALGAIAQYKEIDLMVTDIIMPGGMNGVELAERARELSPRLKIVFSSGFPADALVERNGTRVDGPMLRKPYVREEFAAIIQRTMEGSPHG